MSIARIQQHAIARAHQRFGILFNADDLSAMVKIIQGNARAYYVTKISNTRNVFYIPYGDRKYKVIYDNTTKQIVTFLTDDMPISYNRQ